MVYDPTFFADLKWYHVPLVYLVPLVYPVPRLCPSCPSPVFTPLVVSSDSADDDGGYKRASFRKRAPAPPKRTCSFKDTPPPPRDYEAFCPPETLAEVEDAQAGVDCVYREFRFLNDAETPPLTAVAAAAAAVASRSRSSSEELLSTPGTGSLERTATRAAAGPEREKPAPAPRPESPAALPLGHLRDSLRKARTLPGKPRAAEAGEAGEVRCGTVPKGARIGTFLASLELQVGGLGGGSAGGVTRSQTVSVRGRQPAADVRRKVEEWRAEVERSMEQSNGRRSDDGIEHNVKPSSLARSSSVHSLPRPPDCLPAHVHRQKSDLGGKPPHVVRLVAAKTGDVTPPTTTMTTTKTANHPSSSSDEAFIDVRSSKSDDEDGQRRLSPAAARKAGAQLEEVAVRKREALENRANQAALDSSNDSLIDTRPDTSTRLAPKQGGRAKPEPATKAAKTDAKSSAGGAFELVKSKLGFMRQRSFEKHKGGKTKEECPPSPPAVPTRPDSVYKPAGARPILPGGMMGGALRLPQQLPDRTSLHHVDATPAPAPTQPVTKETVVVLSAALVERLAALHRARAAGTASLLQFSDQVRAFYNACSTYVEALPPHGKFQFREMLESLNEIADGLRTGASESLLAALAGSLREISDTVNR